MTYGGDSGDVALAFILASCAGLATTLGAALVFWGRFVSVANKSVLSAGLAFAAGVMLWVSFVEIWGKALEKWANALPDESEGVQNLMTFMMFWAGIALVYLLDLAVHKLEAWGRRGVKGGDCEHGAGHCHDLPEVTEEKLQAAERVARGGEAVDTLTVAAPAIAPEAVPAAPAGQTAVQAQDPAGDVEAAKPVAVDDAGAESQPVVPKDAALARTGVLTALSIALHNFPEGLITIVATLDDPKVGAAMALAVAIHNVPEGLCVSIPIYYATGNRWRAFRMAFLSGLAEIVGAVLGYLVLLTVLGDVAYAIMFGLVAGMMVAISVKELIPTAYRYADDAGKGAGFVTAWIWAGMVVMGVSLILFML